MQIPRTSRSFAPASPARSSFPETTSTTARGRSGTQLTLGGGFGWLSRKYGMTVDNLESVEVVTAAAAVIRASAAEHPDLFWALRDHARANALYAKACDHGAYQGCADLGVNVLNGAGAAPDPPRAAKLYELACAHQHWDACAGLGDLYTKGVGVAADVSTAADLAERSCAAGSPIGCNNLGVILQAGGARSRDEKRAAELYGRACDGGYPLGCFNLGMMREADEPTTRGRHDAAALYRRGCAEPVDVGRVDCCASLALLAVAHIVDDFSDVERTRWLREGCKENVPRTCKVLQFLGENR
jgi:TPR repeat protein